MAFQITFQGVERPGWSRKIFWLNRLVKSTQLKTQLCGMGRLNAGLVTQ